MHNSDPPAQQTAKPLHWLLAFLRPERKAILRLLLTSLTATALTLTQPWLTKMLIDDGLMASNYGMLASMCAVLLLAGLASLGLSGINRLQHTKLSGRILFALRADIYAHLQKLSPSFFARRRLGDLLSRLDSDVAEIQRFAVDSLFAALSSLIGLIGTLALLITLSWKLSLLAALLLPLEFFWLRRMRSHLEKRTRALRESSSELSSFLVESLPAIKLTQASGQEQAELQRLGTHTEHYMDKLIQLQKTELWTQALPSTLTSASRAAIFLLGGYWVMQGQWQLGSLIAFSTYLGMAIGPVKSLLNIYVATQRMQVSLGRAMELRQAPVSVRQAQHPMPVPTQVLDLQLSALEFRYPDSTASVLSNVNAVFHAGQKIALHGASGAGKSTLIDLLLRFEDPQQGCILYGGQSLTELDLQQWRKRIALVSQETVLFRASLRENIGYACPQADEQSIAQAAQRAGLGEWISSLEHGLQTQIGERGQQLSGGQRQRISIARALLQDPAILVLDEATSAVDLERERLILAEIDHLFHDRTRILVSHRPETLAGADQHWLLQHGELREIHSHPSEREQAPSPTNSSPGICT